MRAEPPAHAGAARRGAAGRSLAAVLALLAAAAGAHEGAVRDADGCLAATLTTALLLGVCLRTPHPYPPLERNQP